MSAQPDTTRPQSLYFVNASVDYLLIGGMSLVFFLFFLLPVGSWATPAMTAFSAYLAWVCNYPHFSASTYRLYSSPAHHRQFPFTSYAVPVLLLAALGAAFASPWFFAPYLVKLYAVWSPYHYAGQSVGISLIYARRAGFKPDRLERFAIAAFSFGIYYASFLAAEHNPVNQIYYGIVMPQFGTGRGLVRLATLWSLLWGVFLLFVAARWSLRQRRLFPPIIFLAPVAMVVWFFPAYKVPAFAVLVPAFHCLQYLIVAWAIQVAEKGLSFAPGQAPRRWATRESLLWAGLNILGGATLFYLLPMSFVWIGKFPYYFSIGVTFAVVQIHHFFVDGVIWRLRTPGVLSPLLVNIPALVRSRRPAAVAVSAEGVVLS